MRRCVNMWNSPVCEYHVISCAGFCILVWKLYYTCKKEKSQSHNVWNLLIKMLTLHIEMSIHMRECHEKWLISHSKLCKVWHSKFYMQHFHTGCALCSCNQSPEIKLIAHFKWRSYRVLRPLSNTLPRRCNHPDIETWMWSLHSTLGVHTCARCVCGCVQSAESCIWDRRPWQMKTLTSRGPPWLQGYGKHHLGLSGRRSSHRDNQPFNLEIQFIAEGVSVRILLLPVVILYPNQSPCPSCAASVLRRKTDTVFRQNMIYESIRQLYLPVWRRSWHEEKKTFFMHHGWNEENSFFPQGWLCACVVCSLPMHLTHHYITSPWVSLPYTSSVCVCVHMRENKQRVCLVFQLLAHLPPCSFP